MKLTIGSLLVLLGCGASPKSTSEPMPQGAAHHHPQAMVHRFENADQWAKVFDDPARDAWQQPDAVEIGRAHV